MTALPIAFRTNESKYTFLGSPRLINCYAEQQGQDAKAPLAVVPCAGLSEFAAPADTPCRGTLYLPDLDCVYSVHSTSVYKTTYDGTAATSVRVGVIPGTDIVQMSRNQADPVQITVLTERGEFYLENDVVKRVTDEDLPLPKSQDHAGGYTVNGIADRRVFISGLNDTAAIDGTDYATAEQTPGPLVRVFANRGDLAIFKTDAIEAWRNTGQADFPFEPVAVIQKGLRAAHAVAPFDNTIAFPGQDAIVYRLEGTQPQRISTHSIERTLESEPAPEAMLGFSHSGEGHSFYTLTGTGWTRAYDAATQLWHSRESNAIGQWRAVFPFRAWGKTIFGDLLSGKLLAADGGAFTEAGAPMLWGLDSPILHVFPNGAVVDALHIDVATGVGVLPASAQGAQPKLMLSWSTDGGATFKGERELPLGAYGDRVRVTTRRLGRFGPKGIQFRLRISDPVIRALVGVDVSLRQLKR